MKEKIKSVVAEEIFDSRGNPTLRVVLETENFGASADVPSGASTGKHEALELRDNDKNRYNGKGVLIAKRNVENTIGPAILGKDLLEQLEIDKIMIDLDGTTEKNLLGSNATIGVSLAVARLASFVSNKKLYIYLNEIANVKPSRKFPFLLANMINGGKHAETPLAFQEYHVVPITEDLSEALFILHAVQTELKDVLHANIGDEGGFVPQFSDVEEPLKIMSEVVEKLGLQEKIKFSLDVAATSFVEGNGYKIDNKKISGDELLDLYKNLIKKYPIILLEDPFEEDDFEMFTKAKKELPGTLIVGDDLTVTNPSRIKEAIYMDSIGAVIIKPNQIGTLSETFETMRIAREKDLECIVSHRSGETNDPFIADLAIATGAFGVKFGALQRGERIAKYNRLLEII